METYRKYFNIDPDFFPAVNSDVIKKEPELWKKYYPHETFIKLLKQTISVLERKQKLNIWVEGAYGTGKSHAVLTLKHLLDSSEEETNEYFQNFKLDDDLRKKLIATKQSGKIITVHRYGSSSIYSDNNLFLAMQESIEGALKDAGISNAGPSALREGIINYLSNEENKASIQVFLDRSYKDLFGGQSVDDVIAHLKEYTGEALQSLMNNVFKLANEKNIKAFTLDDTTMVQWITEVIEANHLKAIVFIWDEFTEYFSNNAHRLTGFQHILDLSQTEPFCFIPVTHKSDAGMEDSDDDKKKILGRFIHPTCIIELPENMAFQLMGAAMQIKDDTAIQKEWDGVKHDLCERTIESRKRIMAFAGIKDEELNNILPIHPYAACLLKQISASFASNQRSMFDFIKNEGNEELKGFQWYIDNYGPLDDNPFLTIDLPWGFFYENGKEDLTPSIRQILDRYSILSKQLAEDEKNVLKTILLLQAMSQSTGNDVEIFLPNEKNLEYAFEGTEFEHGGATNCAEKLIRDKIIYRKQLKDGTSLYSVLTGEIDADEIDKKKAEYENRSTNGLIKEGMLEDAIELPHDLRLRYRVNYVGTTEFEMVAKQAISKAEDDKSHFYVVVCLSKSPSEETAFNKKIKELHSKNLDSSVLFVESKVTLGEEEFAKWVENMATSSYYTGKDNGQASQYNDYAKQVLYGWRSRVAKGAFTLYQPGKADGEFINSVETLGETFKNIDAKRFPLSLECNFKSINSWWDANSLQVGVECGATRTVKGTYNNKNASLQVSLDKAWATPDYWEQFPSEPISRIKIAVEDLIQTTLKADGRISIRSIYDFLKGGDFGFLPCNMTAFFIGFLLSEYADDKYSWSDGLSSDSMSIRKLKEMADEIIKLQNTSNGRYRDKYIVTMTPEEKAFINGTSEAFDIPKQNATSIESVRDTIRSKMKGSFYFPIWTVKEILDDLTFNTPRQIIEGLIDDYQNLTNNTTGRSDNDIAIGIGKKYLEHKSAQGDLRMILTSENCKNGMIRYLDKYNSGELPDLAAKVKDGGQYINELKKKFNADEANWVWKKETADQQIDSLIVEYKIASQTNDLIASVQNYKDAINEWMQKCDNIKVSFETVKNEVHSDVKPLLQMLKSVKIAGGNLQENDKATFLDLITTCGSSFNSFYASQEEYFKKGCSFYLQGLTDSDIDKVFARIPSGYFTTDNATYSNKVEEVVTKYKKELGSLKLKNLWKDKTSTDSPWAWSERYQMPILAMIPDNELKDCRKSFGVLGNHNPSDSDIEFAQIYLDKFSHWEELNDADQRDKTFKEKLLGDKSVMITDLANLKNFLRSHSTESPYNWMGTPSIQKLIDDYAQSEYNKTGYTKAMSKIDSMDADDVKSYLKELIKNNMKVGIQIIMNN